MKIKSTFFGLFLLQKLYWFYKQRLKTLSDQLFDIKRINNSLTKINKQVKEYHRKLTILEM